MNLFSTQLLSIARRRIRAIAYLVLCSVMLAPKVSLAVSYVMGDGYRTVIICNGAGIQRVTVSPDGQVIEDLSQHWETSHCVLGADVNASLEQSWKSVSFRDSLSQNFNVKNQVEISSVAWLTDLTNRGPPAQ